MSEKSESINNEIDAMSSGASHEDMFLEFSLGEENYAVKIMYIDEIVVMQTITKLPNMPHYVKGLVNLRGRIIPVVDIRLLFEIEEKDYDERTCIIIISYYDKQIGFIVDSVTEVISILDKNISPPSKLRKDKSSFFIKGFGKIGENVKIILDVEKLFISNIMSNVKEKEISKIDETKK